MYKESSLHLPVDMQLILNPCLIADMLCLLGWQIIKVLDLMLCSLSWYVMHFLLYTVLAFTVVASGQCNKVQLMVNDTEFTADILYMPVNSSIVVECECTSGKRKSDWLYSNETVILACTNNSDLICTRHDINAGVLLLSRLLEGSYTCKADNVSKMLHIGKLG